MDRQRSPLPTAWDGTKYAMDRANHVGNSGVGAAGVNAALLNGSVRWMNLTSVWHRADPSSNQYGTSGYAEGGLPQYVDDELANEWR